MQSPTLEPRSPQDKMWAQHVVRVHWFQRKALTGISKRPNHTNRSIIFHTLLSTILTVTVSDSGRCQRAAGVTQFRSTCALTGFMCKMREPLLYPEAGQEYSGINHNLKVKTIYTFQPTSAEITCNVLSPLFLILMLFYWLAHLRYVNRPIKWWSYLGDFADWTL